MEQVLPKIKEAIKDNLPEHADQIWVENNIGNARYSISPDTWNTACSKSFYELFRRGGKRIRPVITCLTHDALAGTSEDIYKFSAIPEIIHTGTLIIDDIEDSSEKRREKPTVHKLIGIPIAVNGGNFLYFYPQLMIANSDLPCEKKAKMYDVIAREGTQVHMGQGMDIDWSENPNQDVKLADYLQMCAYKTGALMTIAAKIGGILADADSQVLDNLGTIATNAGMGFQIRDDYLNLKPTEGVWGKETGEDITEGKATFFAIDTLNKADPDDKKTLTDILNSNTKDEEEIKRAISIIDKYGSFDEGMQFAHYLIDEAKQKVDRALPDSDYKRIFKEILDYTINREK